MAEKENRSKGEYLEKLYKALVEGRVSDLSDEDLQQITAHTVNPNYRETVKFEVERRRNQTLIEEMHQSTKMQKWVAIATILMAIATFLIVFVTWIKT